MQYAVFGIRDGFQKKLIEIYIKGPKFPVSDHPLDFF